MDRYHSITSAPDIDLTLVQSEPRKGPIPSSVIEVREEALRRFSKTQIIEPTETNGEQNNV